jgi:hypothetical protein
LLSRVHRRRGYYELYYDESWLGSAGEGAIRVGADTRFTCMHVFERSFFLKDRCASTPSLGGEGRERTAIASRPRLEQCLRSIALRKGHQRPSRDHACPPKRKKEETGGLCFRLVFSEQRCRREVIFTTLALMEERIIGQRARRAR